jgi:hypothetical protein
MRIKNNGNIARQKSVRMKKHELCGFKEDQVFNRQNARATVQKSGSVWAL